MPARVKLNKILFPEKRQGVTATPGHCLGSIESSVKNDTECRTPPQNHAEKKLRDLSHRGFTFIELMISITIVSTALFSLLAGYSACLTLNEISRNMIVVTEETRRVVEEMRSLSVNALSDITSRNWTTWAAANGFNNLPSETVAVAYTDRDATGTGTDDDPLDVTVTISWQEKGRARSFSLITLITVR